MKNLLPYLPVIVLAFTLIGGWFRLNADTSLNKDNIKELKTDIKIKIEKVEADIKNITAEGDKEIKALKEENGELSKQIEVNKVQQDEIQKDVQQINSKTDKIYELLLQQAEKKKK